MIECLVIPAWILGIAGLVVGMIGVHLGKYYTTAQGSPFWVLLTSGICIPMGVCTTLAVLCMYAEPIVLPLLPSITVIP